MGARYPEVLAHGAVGGINVEYSTTEYSAGDTVVDALTHFGVGKALLVLVAQTAAPGAAWQPYIGQTIAGRPGWTYTDAAGLSGADLAFLAFGLP